MLYDKLQDAISFINKNVDFKPHVGIIPGTGLNGILDEIKVEECIPYAEIPHFPIPTVISHDGQLIFGTYRGVSIAALKGRFHFYEGIEHEMVTFGVRILAMLGIKQLLITNITGSLNPVFKVGDLILVRDHINLQSSNPLRGVNDDRLGPRFPSMLRAYDPSLQKIAHQVAHSLSIPLQEGVYVSMNGPSLETPAEYNFLSIIGGDIVGMSTVSEVIVARQHGLETLVISMVSNKCLPIEELKEDSIEIILKNVSQAAPKMKMIIDGIVDHLK
ncbi:MAG: purine-nucleoside phosphorylase [Bacteroidia bacterium]|nr:purine-nucleoside phosphorylase [Bacteroidia bacterium]